MAITETLLIDGDVYAYQAACAAQQDLEYPETGFIYRWAHKQDGELILDQLLDKLISSFAQPPQLKVFLTETTGMAPNWRSKLYADYKANRSPSDRPQLLSHLRGYMRDKWGATSVPGLEADDLLGMAASVSRGKTAQPIIVTKDKDLRTVPGRLHIIGQYDPQTGAPIIETVTQSEAVRWHMAQTLAGDRVDNYEGCPGMGMTRALRVVERPVILYPQNGTITRGPRKGDTTTKWMARPTTDVWACVVSHYVKEGLTEEDALRNARLAYIMRDGDYDWTTSEVKLWEPYKC